ncbi:MAG: polar amino acid ABC transporter ATP-binding protein [Desulfobacteraceae bacterium 4572_35.1]|nr:MAG: polar amino acid ABC transporter ATP-binding protein [Desulfobacteraceae bacterium 4572_35.1]
MSMIELIAVDKKFGTVKALDGVNLQVNKGEVVTIIGPSGSGKSTLLRSINELEKIDSGRIEVEGRMLVEVKNGNAKHPHGKTTRELSKKLGMVFQHFNLFPHKTVLENIIEAPMIVDGLKRGAAVHRALSLLKVVGLEDKQDSYPSRISGGQKQRVAIARALAMEPEVLLCDEPTSALDPELVGEVLLTLKQLADEHMTMVVVTHEMAFAREISDRLIFMDQGRILANGTPQQVLDNPEHPRIKEFIDKFI